MMDESSLTVVFAGVGDLPVGGWLPPPHHHPCTSAGWYTLHTHIPHGWPDHPLTQFQGINSYIWSFLFICVLYLLSCWDGTKIVQYLNTYNCFTITIEINCIVAKRLTEQVWVLLDCPRNHHLSIVGETRFVLLCCDANVPSWQLANRSLLISPSICRSYLWH